MNQPHMVFDNDDFDNYGTINSILLLLPFVPKLWCSLLIYAGVHQQFSEQVMNYAGVLDEKVYFFQLGQCQHDHQNIP